MVGISPLANIFTLPLTSELDVLCGEDANPTPRRLACGVGFFRESIKKGPLPMRTEDLFGTRNGNRTHN